MIQVGHEKADLSLPGKAKADFTQGLNTPPAKTRLFLNSPFNKHYFDLLDEVIKREDEYIRVYAELERPSTRSAMGRSLILGTPSST